VRVPHGRCRFLPRRAGYHPAVRIDFHFNVEHRLQYACRVVRRARAADCRVLLFSRDADRLARLDAALWTFSALDFVPHVAVDSPLAERTPVLLTSSLDGSTPACPVLVNLDDDVPPELPSLQGRFDRLIEIVSREDDDRRRARERFRIYRDAGFEPQAHDRSAE
jgi:DNA polymerase-3 subunit chi